MKKKKKTGILEYELWHHAYSCELFDKTHQGDNNKKFLLNVLNKKSSSLLK